MARPGNLGEGQVRGGMHPIPVVVRRGWHRGNWRTGGGTFSSCVHGPAEHVCSPPTCQSWRSRECRRVEDGTGQAVGLLLKLVCLASHMAH